MGYGEFRTRSISRPSSSIFAARLAAMMLNWPSRARDSDLRRREDHDGQPSSGIADDCHGPPPVLDD